MPDIETVEGGCLCGQVRYTMPKPKFAAICHCRNCQKQSGTAFSFNVGIKLQSLVLSGNLKAFSDVGESGNGVLRQFCPDCGSPVLSTLDAMPGFGFVKAGTLDDPTILSPTMQVFARSALPWTNDLKDLPAEQAGR